MKSHWLLGLVFAGGLYAETLSDLLREIEANNPAIAAARARWLAAREQIAIAPALPDPQLSYGIYLEEIQTRTGPQEQRASLSQTIPLWGKRTLRRESAQHQAAAHYAHYRATRAKTLFSAKKIGPNATISNGPLNSNGSESSG